MILSANISLLMRPTLNALVGDEMVRKGIYKQIYKTYPSKLNYEEDVEMQYSGYADLKREAAPTAETVMGQRNVNIYTHKVIALKFTISREALADNQYKTSFPQTATHLGTSLAATKDLLGAAPFNNAFNPAYPVGDGQPLCSTAHPIYGGTYSNVLNGGVGIDLSETSLQEMLTTARALRLQNGLLAMLYPEKLLVAPGPNEFASYVTVNSAYAPGNANNALNSVTPQATGAFKQGIVVNDYLLSAGNWFGLLNVAHGMKHFERDAVTTNMWANPDLHTVIADAYERYSFGNSDPRAVIGAVQVV